MKIRTVCGTLITGQVELFWF